MPSVSGLSRPDLQLLFIPFALLSGVLAAALSPLSISVGAGAGSVLASLAVVDGVALNPPTAD
ncbi:MULTISPECIES: hypothetical protein [Halolamina]|uniref:Uncharacterized protein n=1 Tax=Halolamina pelagica TaxID=699431 RepID=A0A1I5UGK0_9EURY|nr:MULTISPECIES: hypothetical protein [Halolamina]NHX37262.1 hypothetical protein [Halolamina sp. R1-12]SFP94382.1 hypothetical protein SAMN05216277_11291 [Halolamina pelagica]